MGPRDRLLRGMGSDCVGGEGFHQKVLRFCRVMSITRTPSNNVFGFATMQE